MCELLCVGVLNPAPPEARTERVKAPDVAWAIRGPGFPPGRLRRLFCGISLFVLFFCESFVPLAACEAGNWLLILLLWREAVEEAFSLSALKCKAMWPGRPTPLVTTVARRWKFDLFGAA